MGVLGVQAVREIWKERDRRKGTTRAIEHVDSTLSDHQLNDCLHRFLH